MHLNRRCATDVRAIAQLSQIVFTPRPDRTVLFQRDGVRLPPCDFNDAIHDLAQPCRNGLKRSPGCHAVTRRPDGAVFFQVQFMELALTLSMVSSFVGTR